MIGAIIGAATAVAGGILGGVQASKARKRAARVLDEQERRAQARYDKDYNQDYTQSASAQNALRKAREIADEYTKRAEGAKAVMGGTDESVAQTKAKANEAIANTTSEIAAKGEALQQRAADNYHSAMNSIDAQRMGYEQQTAAANAQAGSQVMAAGMNMASHDADMFGLGGRKKEATPIYRDVQGLTNEEIMRGLK